MKSCITTSHLYGMGGGAKAVFWIAKALMGYGPVTIFTRTAVPQPVLDEMPRGIYLANWYAGCSAGHDVNVNVDHFNYEWPLAVRNIAHIFHPHKRNKPPDGYELWGNSEYTVGRIKEEWDTDALVYYLPVEDDLYSGRKDKRIVHISRFSAPNQYADKGHRVMIEAFRRAMLEDWQLVMAGATDPSQGGYMTSLMDDATGVNIKFAVNLSRRDLTKLLSTSAIYWHMTGVSMPNVPGAQEHLGIATIEALSSGCVPVVLGTGGQPEIVRDRVCGLLARDANDLVRKTRKVANDLSIWSLLQQQTQLYGRAWTEGDWYYDGFKALMDGESMVRPSPGAPKLNYTINDVDIIIPIHNTTTLDACLNSIVPGPIVIVVDNGSDNSVTHPRIDKYVRLDSNRGFAGGNMAGFEASERPVVLALNDDCIAPEGDMWLTTMLLALSEKDVGVVGAKLLYPDGRLQHSGILLDFHREDIGFHRHYGMGDGPGASVLRPFPAVTGACLMCKREFFDMRADLYESGNYEDVHLCLNAWEQGAKVMYQPAATLTHIEAVTKRAIEDDYINHNRSVFVEQWRDKFLDSDAMRRARKVNVE